MTFDDGVQHQIMALICLSDYSHLYASAAGAAYILILLPKMFMEFFSDKDHLRSRKGRFSVFLRYVDYRDMCEYVCIDQHHYKCTTVE